MTTSTTLTVRGIKLRTATMRRYVVVAVRPVAVVTDDGTYVEFARVEKRSDNLTTAQTHARRMRDNGYRGLGLMVVVVDTTTGEEV